MKKIIAILFTFLLIFISCSNLFASDYEQYLARFNSIKTVEDIEKMGYKLSQVNPIISYINTDIIKNTCTVLTTVHNQYSRVAVFFADENGVILYKTEDLSCNTFLKDSLIQPNIEIAAIAERDIDNNGYNDIVIVSRCLYNGKKFKIADILFQGSHMFYSDWRISDKLNRFSMNKDIDMVTLFASGAQSSEFLYSVSNYKELVDAGFTPLTDQIFQADFEKFGTVNVVPGTYKMGNHHIFILYLVDKEGKIVWNFQCMRDYDNFSKMTGISFKDVDGDGWEDFSVLAEYKTLNDNNETYTVTDFSIYYQRMGYFFEDKDFHSEYFNKLEGTEIMDDIIQVARNYWGW